MPPASTSSATTTMAANRSRPSAKTIMTGSQDELSWEKLKKIERRRRAVLRRTELPLFQMLVYWDGTIITALLNDVLWWGTMSIYIAVRVWSRFGLPEFVSNLGGADISVIGSFLSFFLVFFVVSSSKRFDTLFNTSMLCEKRIFDAAALAKTTMPKENALRLIRYMNAVHVTGYVGLSDTYSYNNFFVPENKLNQFLTPEEVARMKQIDMDEGTSCYRELVTWCCAEITTACNAGFIDSRLASQLRDIVLKLSDALTTLVHYDDQPVSFFYVHFICLLSILYLPLFSISAALDAGVGDDANWVNDVIAGLVVALQNIFVIGLRILGQKQNDPFGDDMEDLSVMHYVNFTWLASRRMLESELPGPVDAETEARLCRLSQPIGDAWEDDDDMDRLNFAKVTGISSGVLDVGVDLDGDDKEEAPPSGTKSGEGGGGGGGCAIQ